MQNHGKNTKKIQIPSHHLLRRKEERMVIKKRRKLNLMYSKKYRKEFEEQDEHIRELSKNGEVFKTYTSHPTDKEV